MVVAARPAETRVGRDQPGDELALRIRERGLIDRPLAQLVQVQRVVVQGSDAVMTDPTTISVSASFDDAECIACSFANATLNKVAFKGAYLPGAQLSSVMTLQNASFDRTWLYCGSDSSGNPSDANCTPRGRGYYVGLSDGTVRLVTLQLWVSYTPTGGRTRTIGFRCLHIPK